MRAARILPDDESCAPARHTFERRRMRAADAQSRPALRAVLQPPLPTKGHFVGRPISLVPRRFLAIRGCLLPLYRAQSCARGHGAFGVRLPLVEPQRECRPGIEPATDAARRISRARSR